MLKLRKPLLPEWRYWPAVPFVILILAAAFGFSLPVPTSNLSITEQRTGVYCNIAEAKQPADCAAQVPTIKTIVKSDSEDCETEKPNKQTYDECLLTRYTGQLSRWTFALFMATVVLGLLGLGGGILSYRQFRLARTEFIATHRPKLFVQTVTVTNKGTRIVRNGKMHHTPASAIITVANGGDTPAFIIEWQAVIYYQRPEAAFTPGLGTEPIQRPKIDAAGIIPGEFQKIGHTQMHVVDDDWEEFVNAGGQMFFIGRITYQGADKIKRNTGFCRRYDSSEAGAWRPVKESEYEYTY